MTTELPPPIRTMVDVLALVQVTPAQGISLLNTLAELNADKDKTLVESLQQAITLLSTM